MTSKINDKEKFVVAHMFQQNPHMGDLKLTTNTFSNGAVSKVAISKLPFEGGAEINQIFTTGLLSNSIYVSVTDGDPVEVGELLSNFEFGDKYGINCSLGAAILLQDNDYLKSKGCFGAVMLRLNTLFFLENFDNEVQFLNDELQFFFTAFLNESEYKTVKEHGAKVFLSSLGDKDFFSIAQ